MSKAKKEATTREVQATAVKVERAGKGGIVPPVEHRWKPGESGNVAGRQSAGAYMKEKLNEMMVWSRDEVQRVYDAEDSTVAERTAAKIWLDSVSSETSAAGVPISGPAFDRISDRTDGKATQRVSVDASSLASTIDLTRLNEEQFATFRELLAIACGTELPSGPLALEGPTQ